MIESTPGGNKPAADRFHMIMAVWGDEYTDILLNYTLPNHLSPRNLPAFCSRHNTVFKIFTKTPDKEKLDASPIIKQMTEMCEVQYVLVDEFDEKFEKKQETNIELMIKGHRLAIEQAEAEDAGLIFLSPDSFFSEGSFESLANIVDEGYEAVMVMGFRVTTETFFPMLQERREKDPENGLRFESRELVQLIMDHMHKFNRACFWDSPTFNNAWPNHINWWVDGEGFLVRNFHYHPLMFKPQMKGVVPERSVDFHYLSRVFNTSEKFYVVDDSDTMACCSLTEEDHFDGTQWGKYPPATSDIGRIAVWINRAADWLHCDFLETRSRFHVNDCSEIWEQVEWESDRVINTILELNQPWRRTLSQDSDGGNKQIDPAILEDPKKHIKADATLELHIQQINGILASCEACGGLEPTAAKRAGELFESLGMFEEAAEYFQHSRDTLSTGKTRMLEKKRAMMDAVKSKNLEYNMAALKEHHPHIFEALSKQDISAFSVGGDKRSGFKVFFTSTKPKKIHRMTYPTNIIAQIKQSFPASKSELKDSLGILFSGADLFDMLPWFGQVVRQCDAQDFFRVIFYEPNPAFFAAALQTADISDLIENGILIPFTGDQGILDIFDFITANPLMPIPGAKYASLDDLSDKFGDLIAKLKNVRGRLAGAYHRELCFVYGSAQCASSESAPSRVLIISEPGREMPPLLENGLQKAFDNMGLETQTLQGMVPDGSLSPQVLLHCVSQFKPELVVFCDTGNYHVESILPDSVRVVSITGKIEKSRCRPGMNSCCLDIVFTPDTETLDGCDMRLKAVHRISDPEMISLLSGNTSENSGPDFEKLAAQIVEAASTP